MGTKKKPNHGKAIAKAKSKGAVIDKKFFKQLGRKRGTK